MDSFSKATEDYPSVALLCEGMASPEWGATSDVAQVVANYLRCHPKVGDVRYPGLKDDPLFTEASHTLIGGFGPLVKFCVGGSWYALTCYACDPRSMVEELEGMLQDG